MNRFNPTNPLYGPRSRFAGSRAWQQQRGISLFAAMVFLVVLSLLAIVSIRGVVMQERMAGNTEDWDQAFQAAESGLRDGEADARSVRVSGSLFDPAFNSCGAGANIGVCGTSNTGIPIWTGMATPGNIAPAFDPCWAGTATGGCGASVLYGSQDNAPPLTVQTNSVTAHAMSALPSQPRYIIENVGEVGGSLLVRHFGSTPPQRAWRITAVGFGNIQNANNGSASRVTLQSVLIQ